MALSFHIITVSFWFCPLKIALSFHIIKVSFWFYLLKNSTVLKKYLSVDGECYASPLNHQLPLYFSAFKDTHAAFGSLGPFCDNNSIEEGSWECNPPFDVNSIFFALKTILSVVTRAEHLGKSVTFSVFFANFRLKMIFRKFRFFGNFRVVGPTKIYRNSIIK